jgi:hypothetical protein
MNMITALLLVLHGAPSLMNAFDPGLQTALLKVDFLRDQWRFNAPDECNIDVGP